jgi:hypothetical protein
MLDLAFEIVLPRAGIDVLKHPLLLLRGEEVREIS